jgi:anti-sigma factor RsiW
MRTMTCNDRRPLLHAYLDGELDLPQSLEMERHLAECSACAAAFANEQALGRALRAASLYHAAPGHLRQRIRLALPQPRAARLAFRVPAWGWVGLAASLAGIVLIAWGVVRSSSGAAAQDLVAQAVVDGHVRSLLDDDHLYQVKSSDKHTIKPWLRSKGKVDFSLPVEDLAAQGFPLLGARVDYFEGRKVVGLVYGHNNKHLINLFVWPAGADARGDTQVTTRQGYSLIHWTQADLRYWAVSDMDEKALRRFVELIQGQSGT